MKAHARVVSLFAVGVAGALAACESVPDFTFAEGDAASPDGAIADANSNDGAISSDASHDSGTPSDAATDAMSSGSDAASCGGGAGDICCGSQICHDCAPSDCATCLGLGCIGGDVCCAKGSSNILCKPSGQGC